MSDNGGDALGKIIMIFVGIGMIVFAASCFKDLPLIGTVYLMPGDNIMNAKVADPKLRYGLFLIGGVFTAFGVFMHVKNQSSTDKSGIDLAGIKEAKELLDSGAISEEEYNKIKDRLIKQP